MKTEEQVYNPVYPGNSKEREATCPQYNKGENNTVGVCLSGCRNKVGGGILITWTIWKCFFSLRNLIPCEITGLPVP